jgi:hypothetical protein
MSMDTLVALCGIFARTPNDLTRPVVFSAQ